MNTLKKALCAVAFGSVLMSGQMEAMSKRGGSGQANWSMESIGAILLGLGAPTLIPRAVDAAGIPEDIGLVLGTAATVGATELLYLPRTEDTTTTNWNKKHRRILNDIMKVFVVTAAHYAAHSDIIIDLAQRSPYGGMLVPATVHPASLKDSWRFSMFLLGLYKLAMNNPVFPLIDREVE